MRKSLSVFLCLPFVLTQHRLILTIFTGKVCFDFMFVIAVDNSIPSDEGRTILCRLKNSVD